MKKEPTKNPQFSEAQIRQVLGSPEGRQLLALLSRGGGQELRQAANAFKNGDVNTAQELLRPLVQTPEAAELMDKINRK